MRVWGLLSLLLVGCAESTADLTCPSTIAIDGMCPRDGGPSNAGDSDAGDGGLRTRDGGDAGDGGATADTGVIRDGGEERDGSTDVDGGAEWRVDIAPYELHFGLVEVGETKVLELAITNYGNAPSSFVFPNIDGPDAATFSISGATLQTPYPLEPGEVATVLVTYAPTASGAHQALLHFDLCNGGCTGAIKLTGNAYEPGDRFLCQTSVFYVADGGTCTSIPMHCLNPSAAPVQVLGVRTNRNQVLWLDAQPEPLTYPVGVPPGGTFDFDVDVCSHPSTSGGSGFRVHVDVDDTAPLRTIEIRAYGSYADVHQGCILNLAAPRVNFGRVAIGETVVRRVDLPVESRSTTCQITPIFVTDPSGFSTSTGPFTIAPGATGQVEVAFTPTASGFTETRFQLHAGYELDLVGFGTTEPRPPAHLVESRSEPLPVAPMGAELAWVGGKDDGYARVPVPFSFAFLGASKSEVWVSANGFLSFEALPLSTLINADFPEAPAPNNAVAWWWDDLLIDGATTHWTDGVTPNRVLHIRLKDMEHVLGSPRFDVEIRLFEVDGAIELHYGRDRRRYNSLPHYTGEFSASAGWEGPNGLVGQDVLGCTPLCRDWDWPREIVYRFTPTP